jgi:WD repeat-containing protein 19
MTHTLVDFLMGETDGVPKDPHYIFHLYMALGNYAQAGTTAIIIAKQEQEMGNYKVAHAILLQTHQELESHKLRVPQDVQRMLSLLHSYVIVKKLVKLNDHVAAARMLVRVAKNISKFPSHVVPILTSTG